jgi:two-component system CheB/CheR fusion protein
MVRERERQKKNIAKKFRAAPPNPKPKRIPPEELSRKESPKAQSFHIVGVGASAGGLEAFTRLLQALPTNTGMGLVLIQHLDPKSDSILTQILSQKTKLPVKEAKDGLAVEPDHVYIMPPNRNMTISGGVLGLSPRTDIRGRHMPIDRFFRSLAEDQKSRAIAVVLSGTASDGAVGLRAIKAEGGITFAQDEKSAKFGGMPHSAAAAGAADFILPPEGIAQELARIGRHPFAGHKIPNAEGRESLIPPNGNGLRAIFTLLKSATGVDFAHYKQATLKRRILRRINLRRMKDLGDYAKFLEDNPGEVEALYHDLLIHITGFFRDPEAFAALADKVFPEITRNRGLRESPVRVWVPGCSTGEEAYSLAIALMEFLGRKAREIPIQIFATDIFEEAINKARTGRYPEAISSDLSAERLDRFFVKMDGGYQVSKFIREMCVFAKHDLTKDLPFSNVDLVSCRNVMIYLGQESQRRAMAAFHYSLKPAGFLLLGKSEAMGRFPDLFAPVDGKHKVYSKKPGPGRPWGL